ncbi:MAG: hypothetical protein HZB11_03225 [Candidatus Yonathbacteria bacterium]|nr:hypothetical protein [Candidatus Yonathbacteria bacterium]
MKMKNQPDNNNFTTSDFYAAAFLVAKGYRLLGIDKADSRRFHFIFTNEPDRPQLVSAFFAGLVEVNAKEFVSAIKELKSLMYNDAMN